MLDHRIFTIGLPKRVVSFFYFDLGGKDEENLSPDGFIGYVNLERTPRQVRRLGRRSKFTVVVK